MQSLNIKTYLLYAIYIIRTNPTILLFVAGIGLINGIGAYLPKSSFTDVTSSITFIATIFINPVIYGIYYEIIEDKYSSLGKIFSTYVAGYLILLFCMYIPIISITASVMSSPQINGNVGFIMITILIFSLLYLYVIPTYYITRTLVGSIIAGVQFLLKNLLNSAPVLLMALFAELLLLFTQYKMVWLREVNLFLFAFMEFAVHMISNIVDFLLFIILIYILKNHGLMKKE